MPRRARHPKRRRVEWSPRIALGLSLGPMPVVPGDSPEPPLDLLAAAWAAYRHLVEPGRPFARSWAFWHFEPDVPAALRSRPAVLEPLRDDREVDDRNRERARHDLARRRRAWLLADPAR